MTLPDPDPIEDLDLDDDEAEGDYDCAGYFDANEHWRCGKIGSEECDWCCPYSGDLGKRMSDA